VTINPKNGYIEAMASSAATASRSSTSPRRGTASPARPFKVMALMAALRAGVDPDATHYTSKSPTKFDDPTYGPIDVSTYADTSAGNISLRKATLLSDNSVYIQLALDVGPDKVKQAARGLGITLQAQRLPAETLGGLETASRRWRWPTPTRRSPPAATATADRDHARSRSPTAARELPGRWKVKRTKAFEDGVTYEATEILEQNIQAAPARTRTSAARGRQDRHDRQNTDAWFVGFTPRLATAVWVGYPTTASQMTGLYTAPTSTAARSRRRSGATYMKRPRASSAATSAAQDAVPATVLRHVLRQRRQGQAASTIAPRRRPPRRPVRTTDDAPRHATRRTANDPGTGGETGLRPRPVRARRSPPKPDPERQRRPADPATG
jgi:penicillin-binding protein 1A